MFLFPEKEEVEPLLDEDHGQETAQLPTKKNRKRNFADAFRKATHPMKLRDSKSKEK